MRTIKIAQQDISKTILTNGTKDKQGREIGMLVSISKITLAPNPNPLELNGTWGLDVGDWFSLYTQSTRDSKRFGAVQPIKYFKTQAEVDAHIEKRKKALCK